MDTLKDKLMKEFKDAGGGSKVEKELTQEEANILAKELQESFDKLHGDK